MSKIMELAEYYATLREDGVRRELEDEARAALQAEVEKIELLATATHIVMAERDALREKLAAVEKDAERYQWLRHGDNDEEVIVSVGYGEAWMHRNEKLDEIIDAAMEATK